jgi:hypothetical protein
MYACSPNWDSNWFSEKDAEKILTQLAGRIKESPFGPNKIGINYGLHFTGGEPFLNFELLLKIVKMANEFDIPSTLVETNCFWCIDDKTTREKMLQLRDVGLDGILLSVNPFVLEHVPFERTERASRISKEVFGENVIIYQSFFYDDFKSLMIKDILSFNEYLQKSPSSIYYVELIPMGRAAYQLGYLYKKLPLKYFFMESCLEELTRGWHIHIDNYCNYVPNYCGGISLGDARNLYSLCQGIDLSDKPILGAIVKGLKNLYEFGVREFGYRELDGGYVSKCHLCLDIRKHIAHQTSEFEELKPREFYYYLD